MGATFEMPMHRKVSFHLSMWPCFYVPCAIQSACSWMINHKHHRMVGASKGQGQKTKHNILWREGEVIYFNRNISTFNESVEPNQ
jgi:hypothetical protein